MQWHFGCGPPPCLFSLSCSSPPDYGRDCPLLGVLVLGLCALQVIGRLAWFLDLFVIILESLAVQVACGLKNCLFNAMLHSLRTYKFTAIFSSTFTTFFAAFFASLDGVVKENLATQVQSLEACAFLWFLRRHQRRTFGNLPSSHRAVHTRPSGEGWPHQRHASRGA